jgi:hippurate hydrolase
MHACGHDIHTTVLIGTARTMAASRSKWHGTLMLIGQPSEETLDDAKAMLATTSTSGLVANILGLHDVSTLPAGKVGIVAGPAMSSATSVAVLIEGVGDHGAYPQLGRDPISLVAQFITQIQTIVSREEEPRSPTVVTVGTIREGAKRSIIPDRVKLTTRSFSDKSRQIVLDGLQSMTAGLTLSAGFTPDKAARVTVLDGESTPVQFNDASMTERVRVALVAALGASNVVEAERLMGSDDIGVFGLPQQAIPVVYFQLGAMDPAKLAAAQAAG